MQLETEALVVLATLLVVGILLHLAIRRLAPPSKRIIASSHLSAAVFVLGASLIRFVSSGGALPISLQFVIGVYMAVVIVIQACSIVALLLEKYMIVGTRIRYMFAFLVVTGLVHGVSEGWRTIHGFVLSLFAVMIVCFTFAAFVRGGRK